MIEAAAFLLVGIRRRCSIDSALRHRACLFSTCCREVSSHEEILRRWGRSHVAKKSTRLMFNFFSFE